LKSATPFFNAAASTQRQQGETTQSRDIVIDAFVGAEEKASPEPQTQRRAHTHMETTHVDTYV
jgi:hypothetical protein